MNSRTRAILSTASMFAMAAALNAEVNQANESAKRSKVRYIVNESESGKRPFCPKGCNHYRFNSMGEFTVNRPMDSSEYGLVVFECYAVNDKNAIRKFQKRNP